MDEMPTGEAMMRFHKPKSGRVKSPPGKIVSRRTDQRAWVFKSSTVPLRALFDYQLHEHSLTLKAVELEAPKGPSAAVTAVEQSSGIGKEL